MANNHTTYAKHNPVELTGNIFVHHPVVPAYKARERKDMEEALRTLEYFEPMYEDRYGLSA